MGHMTRLLKGAGIVILASLGVAYAQSPGIQNTPADGFTSFANGGYVIGELVGRQLITQPSNITLSCPSGCPATFAFDYAFTYQGTRQTVHFTHTPTVADMSQPSAVQQMLILSDFQQQFASNATIRAAIGADIVDFSYVRREPGYGKPYQFQFFQSVPFLQSGANPVLTAVSGTAVYPGNDTLEISPFLSFVRTTADQGRPPKAGDLIGGIYFSADLLARGDIGAPARPADSRNVDPIYGSIIIQNIDPAYGKSKAIFTFDAFQFQDNNGNPGNLGGVTKNCTAGMTIVVVGGLVMNCG
jgi:hypothetical protein